MDNRLSDRQRREREYYNRYSARNSDLTTTFDPVDGRERRPWNSYWFVYETVRNHFKDGCQRLLDFGCGAGVASVRFARIGYEVFGFDISENNVNLAAERAKKYGLADRTHFDVGVAEKLEYENNFFDVVAGIDIIHHVEVELAMREVRRVLKPDGVAVFREWIEVPVFDSIRNSALVRRFFPKGMSLKDHRTMDERKLNTGDVAIVRRVFGTCEETRFCILSRLRKVLPVRHPEKPSRLEMLDRRLMQACPPLKTFGGEVVFVLSKQPR